MEDFDKIGGVRFFDLTYFGNPEFMGLRMKKYMIPLLLTTAPTFAGEVTPATAPAPQSACPQGWTVGLEALALKAYAGYSDDRDDADYEFGFRGSVGYEFSDCLFVKFTGFGYSADLYDLTSTDGDDTYRSSEEFDASYFDLVVGQHFTPGDKFSLSPYAGLRWAEAESNNKNSRVNSDNDSDSSNRNNSDFSGLGIVVGIDATRSLANGFSLYGTAKQSVVFGSYDQSNSSTYDGEPRGSRSSSSDDVLFISELGLGMQYDFSFSNVSSNVRLGVEGQWWAGAGFGAGGRERKGGGGGGDDIGLAGFVLGANFRF